ncbi:DUF2231 domain-containing protein [Nocardia sp. NPDC050718]|uniref:DUF2231 domain-containing protein n=1 Tax=unclassified Nocardia TaxID=2637762 RepID=UPI003406D431
MSTINGLPAHILLVHLLVVLVPLTALLLILAALWPAARRVLVWPTAALAALTVALTPVTVSAGRWLAQRVGRTPAIQTHIDLGGTLLYFVIPMLVVAALLVGVHLAERAGRRLTRGVVAVVAVLAVAAGVAATVQVVRVGDSGARATWGPLVSATG